MLPLPPYSHNLLITKVLPGSRESASVFPGREENREVLFSLAAIPQSLRSAVKPSSQLVRDSAFLFFGLFGSLFFKQFGRHRISFVIFHSSTSLASQWLAFSIGIRFKTCHDLLPRHTKGERSVRGCEQSEKQLEEEATTGHKQRLLLKRLGPALLMLMLNSSVCS